MTFASYGLNKLLVDNTGELNYTEPTPIQEQAIPLIMEGSDVIGLAQTGTGKTAAFALPMIDRLMLSERSRAPRALIVAPTRELAEQIFQACRQLGKGSGISGVTMYGGTAMRPQLRALERGVDVVIGCPGRILDHLERGTFDPTNLEMVVFDEADQMFDMGFFPVIRRIKEFLPTQRQTLLFTATMPKEIKSLAEEIVTNAKTIKIGKTGLSKTVSHNMYSVADSQKRELLLELIKDSSVGSAIVFTRTKRRAKAIDDLMSSSGVAVTSLQGNLSQAKRQRAIDGFRSGKFKVLIATDIAARGIDISQVSHVINFDMPDTVEAYTHRTGRTGRAERLGDAISFVTSGDRRMLKRIQGNLRISMKEIQMPVSIQGAKKRKPNSASGRASHLPSSGRSAQRRPSASSKRRPQSARRRNVKGGAGRRRAS
ncbi:DEAD/DEAH box helicase [bacterium]|nr:DEAD/DEAH box helicase [bacterium]